MPIIKAAIFNEAFVNEFDAEVQAYMKLHSVNSEEANIAILLTCAEMLHKNLSPEWGEELVKDLDWWVKLRLAPTPEQIAMAQPNMTAPAKATMFPTKTPAVKQCTCTKDQVLNHGCVCGAATPYKPTWH
jgi:hypothetical protein